MADETKACALNEEKSLFYRVVTIAVYALFGIILAFTIQQNISYIHENPLDTARNKAVPYITVGLLMLLFFAISKLKFNTKVLLGITLAISFALRLTYALSVQTEPTSDFGGMYRAAQSMLEGDYSWVTNKYFTAWAFQKPFASFQALALAVHNSINTLKILNVFFMMGINILIYLFAREFASERAAITVALLYAIYPAPIQFASVLTNQHSATFFLMLGAYLLFRLKRWWSMIIAAFFLCVGNLCRSEGPIVIIALLAILLLFLIEFAIKHKNSEAKKYLLYCRNAGVVVLSYLAFMAVATVAYEASPIGENGIGNNVPQWKIVVGLNPESAGTYNWTDSDIIKIKDNDERWAVTKERVAEKFEDIKISEFVDNKTKIMWAENEGFHWSMGHMDLQKNILGKPLEQWVRKLTAYDKGIYLTALIMAFLSAILAVIDVIKHRNISSVYLFSIVIFLGTYIAYLFIEIQTRYRYFTMPFLFIAAVMSIDRVQLWFSNFEFSNPKKKRNDDNEGEIDGI